MKMPEVGEIWRHKYSGNRLYITEVNEDILCMLCETGEVIRCWIPTFVGGDHELIEPTGDRVPFEDIAAILFPDKHHDAVDNMFKGE